MTNLRQPVYKTLLEIKEYYREYQRAAQQVHCPEAAGRDRDAAVEKIRKEQLVQT